MYNAREITPRYDPELAGIIAAQRAFFAAGKTREVAFRRQLLQNLGILLRENEAPLLEALRTDLGKSHREAQSTELAIIKSELGRTLRHLTAWTAPRICLPPCTGRILPRPRGIVMLFSPWSDPLRRAILPLIASVAAGNCTILKLSEHVPHVSALLAALLDRYFDREYIAAWTDTFEAVSAIRREPLGMVYFTGGSAAARIVCRAAAAQLTPVITDIGGKSPCIVDASADLRLAARRIVAAKLLSAGQTCAAPDDLFIERSVKAQFLACVREAHDRLYSAAPCENPQYPKIVNRMHFERLKRHLSDGRILLGGDVCEESCRIALTLMEGIAPGSVLYSEEIFGPILPVHTFDGIDGVIRTLRRRAKPPALYLFSRDRTLTRRVLSSLAFGTACVNDAPLPSRGMVGCPHGKAGFELFSLPAAVRSGRHFL